MADNLIQSDQGGTNCQFIRTYLGPTIGWTYLPISPELVITGSAAVVLGPYASRVLLKGAVRAVALPAVTAWIQALLQVNQASFDRSIWIKDLGYNASAGGPIVITAAGTDQIDGSPTVSITTAGAMVKLFPLTDLTGWYIG